MNDKYWYVDEDFNILVGEEAKRALKKNSDASYLSQDQGIVQIPRERWEKAQVFEQKCWMVQNTKSGDDRNWDHYYEFNGYQALQGLTFEHAIELGCGPFTNLRLILKACRVRKCTLLDPLIESYFVHPRCRYNRKWLFTDNWLYGRLDRPRLLRGVRRVIRRVAPGLLYDRHPVQEFISKPIEEMPISSRYDLIVIINVLEHCYDIHRVLENILQIATPGAGALLRGRSSVNGGPQDVGQFHEYALYLFIPEGF